MLLRKDKDNEKCLYECDRCKRTINTLNKINILVAGFAENPRITYNLCPHCYKMTQKWIKCKPNIKGGTNEIK